MATASTLNKITTSLFFGIASLALGQTPAEEFRQIKQQFPDQEYVFTHYDFSIDLKLENNQVVIKHHTIEEGICLDDNYSRYMENSVYESAFRKLEKVDAYSLIPGEKKYTKNVVNDFSEHTILEGSVFHDDSKKLTYHFQKLQRGAKVHEEVYYNVTEPQLMPSFYAHVYRPVLSGKFMLTVDEGIEVEFIYQNTEQLNLNLTETKKSGKPTVYEWTFENFKGFEYESGAPPLAYFAPHILLRIKSYKTAEGVKYVNRDLSDLHNWYCDFLKQNTADSSNALQKIVDEITLPSDSPGEAAAKIYAWVQKNVKYIAVEDGYNGFKPQAANAVCSSRYGDCKGMSNLLYNMLKIRGIESHLTWVGTRDIPYRYDEVPLAVTDNHMIVTYVENGKNYFLDPTHDRLEFKTQSPFIQGKQVLINKECESFELDIVPVAEANHNLLYDSVIVTMNGKDLIGEGYATLTGYTRMNFLSRMRQTDSDYIKDYCRGYFQKGSNKFLIDSVSITEQDDNNVPLKIYYKFNIKDFNIELNNERYVDMNLDAFETPSKIEDNREYPIEYDYKMSSISVTTLNLDGAQINGNLPQAKALGSDELKFDVNYERLPDSIKRVGKIQINTIMLQPEQFENWNKAVSDIQKNKRTRITINLN